MKIIRQIPPEQPKNKFIALDIELFNLNSKQLHRPTSGEFACLSIATDPETVYVITDKLQLPMAFSRLRDTVHTYHHAKFDITHLRRWVNIEPRKKLWDTMLIERIMYGGYFDLFALEHLARRWLDIRMDKSLQKSFENATELSEEQIHYAALDASTTLQIALAQRKVIRKSDFKVWTKIELPALWAYMDFQGFAINVAKWKALAELNEKRAKDFADKLPYNPRSPKQVKEALSKKGFKRLPSTGQETLEKFIIKYPDTKAAELAVDTLKSRKYHTRASRYGMKFIEDFVEHDIQFQVDMIYCDYKTVGAETGRTASAKPNMQNIIARDTSEFRECFIPRPDNVLLICDYSQQEPGCSAHLTRDKKLIKIINSGQDIYILVAKILFNEKITKGDKRRKTMKSLVLGTNYGMSAWGLASREDMTKAEASKLIHKYFRAFPDVGAWVNKQSRKKDYVETAMGRRIWLNKYSSQVERNALNAPIQGTAADMTKMAVSRLHRDWKYPYPFAVVATVHDEIVLDVPKNHAQKIARFVKKTMEDVAKEVCPSVTIKADVIIGSDWGSKS
jgi:DNA polymerase I-like protein with 3'-5' exonuclease and polymerase domains